MEAIAAALVSGVGRSACVESSKQQFAHCTPTCLDTTTAAVAANRSTPAAQSTPKRFPCQKCAICVSEVAGWRLWRVWKWQGGACIQRHEALELLNQSSLIPQQGTTITHGFLKLRIMRACRQCIALDLSVPYFQNSIAIRNSPERHSDIDTPIAYFVLSSFFPVRCSRSREQRGLVGKGKPACWLFV